MRRRRGGSRFTWMPMLGTTFSGGEGGYQANVLSTLVSPRADNSNTPTTAGGGITSMAVMALVPDYTEEPDPGHGVGMTLRDYTEGQDWFCRRIVGKIAAASAARSIDTLQDAVWPATMLTAGLFVARARDDNQAVPDSQDGEIDAQSLLNIRQPWIWRRTWILGNSQVSGGTDPQLSTLWPNSTEGFGALGDGPHVDAKTFRRILREQRLWLTFTALGVGLPGDTAVSGADNEQPVVQIYTDLRVLGAMRKSKNKSAF